MDHCLLVYTSIFVRGVRGRARIFLNLLSLLSHRNERLECKLHVLHQEEKWNHHDFMRRIWCLFKMNDRRSAMSPYNTAFTHFWSQIIFYGMHKVANCDDPKRDFVYFLIVNPSLSNDFDSILQKYYSPKMIEKMRENPNEMILPDLIPLPSMITNVKKIKVKVQIRSSQQRFRESDDEFIKHFEGRTFSSFEGHISFLRVIWCYIHLKDEDIETKWREFDEFNYNLTKTHFYIRMVRYYNCLYHNRVFESSANESSSSRSFDGFLNFCSSKRQCRIEHDDWWKEYYSETLLQNEGKNKLMMPDLKKLPEMRQT